MPQRFLMLTLSAMLPNLAGCVWLSTCADFERPKPMGISSPTLQAYVDVERDYKSGVFLMWQCSWTKPPHSLNIYSDDASSDVVACVITDLTVQYADDEALQRPGELPATAEYEARPAGANSAKVEYTAKLTFPGLIEREESFTLEIEGYYQMRDGTRRPFKSSEYIEVSRDPLVRPIAVVWANV